MTLAAADIPEDLGAGIGAGAGGIGVGVGGIDVRIDKIKINNALASQYTLYARLYSFFLCKSGWYTNFK
jgi:hypothetical protein